MADTTDADAPRVVAIGGSLGSLKALKTVLAAFDADFPAAVLIVVHVGSAGHELFAEALANAGPLPVVVARDGMRLRRGVCYLAAAEHHLVVLDGVARTGRGPRENMSRPSIDPLFRSLALAYGPAATAVLLSGLLNDGVAGLEAVRRCGGVTVVQNPSDAEAGDMPLAALRALDVDYRGGADEIGPILRSVLDAAPVATSCDRPDVRLEVEIALGRPVADREVALLGAPSQFSCPACGGVLTRLDRAPPLRFRCQVGHAYTAEALEAEQEGSVDEAMRIALRIVTERAALTEKMAEDAGERGMKLSAQSYRQRSADYREQVRVLQVALLRIDAAAAEAAKAE